MVLNLRSGNLLRIAPIPGRASVTGGYMNHHFTAEEMERFIESGDLDQLYSLLKQPPNGKDKAERGRMIVEFFCKRMWKQLGHTDPRSLVIPFFLDDLSTHDGFLKLLAPGHLTLVVSFIGELIDMLSVQNASASGTNYSLYQALLSVNIINWLTTFSHTGHPQLVSCYRK